MKILHIIQRPQLRGAEIFACQLASELKKCGHQVLMVSLFRGNADLNSELDFVELNLAKRSLVDYKGWKELSQVIKEFDPDIVQANASDTLKYSVFSKLLFRWKAPIVFRNANKMGDFISSKAKLFFNKFLVNKLDYVISVSRLCEDDFKLTFNYPQNRITTIPIGVDIIERESVFPKDLEHLRDRKILVNVGSLVPEKNHIGLLRIFDEIKKSHDEIVLLVIGDGQERVKLEKYIKQQNLDKEVFLLGYRNDVFDILSGADLFLMPSFIEGLPGVILEAFQMQVPVIANDVGGISEVVQNEITGLLIPKNDPDKFVKSVLDLLANESKSSQLTKMAKELMLREYTNHMIAERFVACYNQVLN